MTPKPKINPYMDDCAEAYERGYTAGYKLAMSEKQPKFSSKDITGFGVVVCSICNEIITCRQAVYEKAEKLTCIVPTIAKSPDVRVTN